MVRYDKSTGQYEKIRETIIIDPHSYSLDESTDENGVGHLFLPGVGIKHNLEMSDYIVNKGDVVPYHCHMYGNELFVVIKGSVSAVVGGKRCTAKPGDMLLIRPHLPHAFKYQEDGTIWHEIVHGMALWEGGKAMDRIIANCPENFNDHEFMREYFGHEGRVDFLGYPFLDAVEVDPAEVPGFSGKGMSYKKYSLPGMECRMKYPRWQLGNLKEIWEFVLDKGVTAQWGKPYFSHELMVVSQGAVEVEVQGYGVMTATAGNIIKIPDYTEHRITALEQGTILQDFNVQFNLFLMMDEIEIAQRVKPETVDAQFYRDVFARYECPLTALSGVLEPEPATA